MNWFIKDTIQSRAAGVMPDSTVRNSIGVGFRQPVTILKVSLRMMSSFLACRLWYHAGEAYTAALYTRARAPVPKLEELDPTTSLLVDVGGYSWRILWHAVIRVVICTSPAYPVSPRYVGVE